MGVTTVPQNQSSTRQSSKDLHSGGRRASRSGSSSASAASSLPPNAQSTKKTSSKPPSKFASQLRKLRKRSSNNNNNHTSPQGTSGSKEKKPKRDEEHASEVKKHKARDTSPDTKRKHLKTGDNKSASDAALGHQSKESREEGTTPQEKHDNKKDLKHSSTTSSSSNSRINNITENNGNSSSNNNIKNRPPVKLTVKFNKSEGGGKKPCQVQVVNSSLSTSLPTISSSTSTASEEKIKTESSNSTPSATKEIPISGKRISGTNKSTKDTSVAALKTTISKTTEPSKTESPEKKTTITAAVPSLSLTPSKSEKDEGKKDATSTEELLEPQNDTSSSMTADFSVDLSSTELVKTIESIGFNDGNISTSLYTRTTTNDNYVPPEVPLRKEELSPATPCIYVRSKEEAFSPQLFELCLQRSIVVVRNLCAKEICDIDLGLFSTKKLVDLHPNHPVEVRFQSEQVSDENWDANFEKQVWYCTSSRGHTTISKYAEYQAGSIEEAFNEASKAKTKFEVNPSSYSFANDPNAQRRTIKFGTNCDLSDEKKWRPQLDELNKLPSWCRLVSAGNMLSHLGHQILGMNTVQLYMKVPCSRTPGHQENNNFCAVNLNIGPGDSEWFGVPNDYWSGLQDICKKNKVDFLHGSWWPNVEELQKMGIPVYRFMQKPGDLVWVNTGCVHWVQAAGWCNNIAWNVGPLTGTQYEAAMERFEWNKTQKYQSIVAMEFLSWNLARNIQVHETLLFDDLRRTLQQSIRKIVQSLNFVRSKGCKVRFHGHRQHESAHYCGICEEEVFNVLLIRDSEKRHVVHCLRCSKSPNIGGQDLKGIIALVQYPLKDLLEVYDNFQLVKARPASNEP